MPLPPSLIKFKPPESLHVRIGDKAGSKGAPRPLDHFVGKIMDGGKEIGDHEFFAKRPKEIPVRLLFDNPQDNWRDGIAFWDGHFPACYNNEGGATAMRREPSGAFRPVQCDLTKCPMWLNGASGSETAKIALTHPEKGYAAAYPHLQITRNSVCRAQFYLLFEIPGVTAPGEVARFYTQSLNSIQQIMSGMTAIAAQTGGILAGIPLKLKVYMIRNRFGSGFVPTVGVYGGEVDIAVWQDKVLEARKGRALSGMNWQAHRQLVADTRLAELTGTDAQFIREHFVRDGDREDGPAVVDAEIDEIAPPENLDPGVLEDEMVQQLCDLLGLSVPERTKLQMKFGHDTDKCIRYLDEIRESRGVEMDDDDAKLDAAISKVIDEKPKPEPEPDTQDDEDEDDIPDAEFDDVGAPPIIPADNEDDGQDDDDDLFGGM